MDKKHNMDESELNTIILDDAIMEKLVIKSDELNVKTNELANDYILKGLANDGLIPEKVLNPKAIIDLLDHDKPEGDDILEKISGIIDVESKFNAVELKKVSQMRRV